MNWMLFEVIGIYGMAIGLFIWSAVMMTCSTFGYGDGTSPMIYMAVMCVSNLTFNEAEKKRRVLAKMTVK